MKKIISIIFFILMITISTIIYAISPESMPTYQGIDVSEWQGTINYNQVAKAEIEIVYIKSSEGTTYIDPYFETNYQKAKENNLKVGVYHYLIARTIQEAEEEATFFSSVISEKQIDCKLALDFESFGNLTIQEINEIAEAFLQKAQQLTEKEMIIYSNTNDARNIFSQELANKYPLWVAEYGVETPQNNGKWNHWEGFQYTDRGIIDGIKGYVDRDKFTKEILLKDNTQIPNNTGENAKEKNIIYIVRRGNTLNQIAATYGTTIENIVLLNNISNPNLIYIGQKLEIPNINEKTSQKISYTVQTGNTLIQIAVRFRTTVEQIVRQNNIANPNLIYPGETLIISNSNILGETGQKIYTIKYGDTLTSISERFNISIQQIVELNNIQNPNLIYAGERIKI